MTGPFRKPVATWHHQLELAAGTDLIQLVGVVVGIGHHIALNLRCTQQTPTHDPFILVHWRNPPCSDLALFSRDDMQFVALRHAAGSASVTSLTIGRDAADREWLAIQDPDQTTIRLGPDDALFQQGQQRDHRRRPADPLASADVAAGSEESTQAAKQAKPKKRAPLKLTEESSSTSGSVAKPDKALSANEAMEKLKPLQILLGKWRGTTRKALVDEPEWIWDLQTDPAAPALVMTSAKGAYFTAARLGIDADTAGYQLTTTSPNGETKRFAGSFIQPVEDVIGDNDKLQRTFKLEFVEQAERAATEAWRVVFNQQENNRFILEIERRRGSAAYARVDTVSTQREGTSFALSDTDFKDKECIISQGLGTISVSYKGKSYWVCCTGCEAAFYEDPQKWIDRYAAMNAGR
jgi:hypothetical protein